MRANRDYGSLWLLLMKLILFIVLLGAFFIGQIIYYENTVFYYWGNYVVLLLYAANLYFTSRIYHGFNFGSISLSEIFLSWILCLIIANALQYLMLSLIIEKLLPVAGFLAIISAQILLALPISFFINKYYYKRNPAQKAIIIYDKTKKAQEYSQIIEKHRNKFKISKIISSNEPFEIIQKCIEKSETVFFLDVDEKLRKLLLEACFTHNKRAYILPNFTNVLLNMAEISWISSTPMMLLKSAELDIGARFIKRSIDILLSLLIIIALSWLMAITWLIIRLYDHKPAIYKQTRITKGGRHFVLFKFRTMREDAEDDGIPRLSTKDDKRVTPFGRFIRKIRIDELPQLFNVLGGSMSLVGPRPERPEIAKQYEEAYPNFSFRTKVKAGITGYAQVYGRYSTAPDEKLLMDIMYIGNFSIWQDAILLLQTIKVVFMPSRTGGVENGSVTALRK